MTLQSDAVGFSLQTVSGSFRLGNFSFNQPSLVVPIGVDPLSPVLSDFFIQLYFVMRATAIHY